MKSYKITESKNNFIKRIAFGIIIIILLQAFMPIIVNFNFVFANGEYIIVNEDGIEYEKQIGTNLYIARINKDLEKVVIKEKLSNGGIVQAYQIRGNSDVSDIDFKKMNKLKELTIPVKLINKDSTKTVFNNATSIEKLELTSLGESGTTELVNMPEFTDLTNLKTIKIGENITKIGTGVFKKIPNLEKVLATGNLKEIESGAFLQCGNLKKIYDIYGLQKIGDYAFYQCTNLEWVDFSNVTKIGEGAFEDCKKFNTVVTATKLSELGGKAFRNSGINGFYIYNDFNITEIPEQAFYGCSELWSVILSDSIKKIGNEAFYECSNVFSITLPKDLESIGNQAFYKCNTSTYYQQKMSNWIHKWEIPSSVKNIGDGAFRGCNKMNIKIPSSVKSIGNFAFSDINGTIECASESYAEDYLRKKGISYKTYDDTVTFSNIEYKLTSSTSGYSAKLLNYKGTGTGCIQIHKNIVYKGNTYPVSEICENAFDSKNMNKVIIPDTVRTIRTNAFSNCKNLTRVDIPKGVANIEKAFINSSNVTIYCYKNSVAETFAKNNKIKFSYLDNGTVGENVSNKNNTSNNSNNTKKENVVTEKEKKSNEELKKEASKKDNTNYWDSITKAVGTAISETVKNIDLDPPKVEWEKIYSGKDKVSIKFKMQDNGVGIRYYKSTENSSEAIGEYTDLGSGKSTASVTYTYYYNGIYYFYAKDVNKNLIVLQIEINEIDSQSPQIKNIKLKSNDGVGKKVTVEWEASDDGVGIKYWKV